MPSTRDTESQTFEKTINKKSKTLVLTKNFLSRVVAHDFNPRIKEAEAVEYVSSRTAREQRTRVYVYLKNRSHVYHTKFPCTMEALGDHEPSKLMERQRKTKNPGGFLAV